ncbi:MAG: 3-phosphoshikimate 1-carboxyvinyltransferase [Chloroflexales bacterium]|nr:3-phosphoshikimate 1-carboxyvinyltransferase [Chloroflexales bacterium]
MEMIVTPSILRGAISIPSSKSHTIRALMIATLADGVSHINDPLISADTLSCRDCCTDFGTIIVDNGYYWEVEGRNNQPRLPGDIVNVGNSGTTMNFLIGIASLIEGYTILTGDHQIHRRPVQPLLDALQQLGARAASAPQTGCPPVVVRGRIKGGSAEVRAKISQFTSSLLLCCPLAPTDTEIHAIDMGEKPYVQMTLHWLDQQQIVYQQRNLEYFWIKGNQRYKSFNTRIPADFSSATFFMCVAAIPGCDIVLKGLDFNDTQGDKAVVDLLRAMGADIQNTDEGLHIRGRELEGAELDLEDMPDALPAMAVVGCLSRGVTRIRNVAHARSKETDRIAIMCRELRSMGATASELPDGLIVNESRLVGATVNSHGDHRIAMALAIAGLAARGVTHIYNADAVNMTFPQFPDLLRQLGATPQVV